MSSPLRWLSMFECECATREIGGLYSLDALSQGQRGRADVITSVSLELTGQIPLPITVEELISGFLIRRMRHRSVQPLLFYLRRLLRKLWSTIACERWNIMIAYGLLDCDIIQSCFAGIWLPEDIGLILGTSEPADECLRQCFSKEPYELQPLLGTMPCPILISATFALGL